MMKNKTARLIITPQNRYYLTGFSSSLGYLFIVDKRKILYVDGRYIEAAKNGVSQGVDVRLLTTFSAAAKEVVQDYAISEIECEIDITVRQKMMIDKALCDISLKASAEMNESLLAERAVKSQSEIENIISAQRIAEMAFSNILDFIHAGVTERDIALRLEYDMRRLGAEGVSFETIAVSGANSSKPHGVPTDKPIENGDFITMDFGALYGGYCSDMTRTVAVGYADDEMQMVYETVLSAQLSGIAKIAPSVAASEVDAAARSVIEKAGYGEYFTHSLGHGVGIDIHEKPNLSPKSDEILQCGNVVTCEPGIYMPEKFGVRIEDMLFVTENGCENITKSEKMLIILK